MQNYSYQNFEIELSELYKIIKRFNIQGFNVTIPYKIDIIPFLDELSLKAKEIGSVNTVVVRNDRLIGYNTDCSAFEESLLPFIKNKHHALILGNGGVSKSVQYVLKKLKINYKIVNRNSRLDYSDITHHIVSNCEILINTTPLGMYPKIHTYPKIPYKSINKQHLLFDLIYNPEETTFLKYGRENGAKTINGRNMLELQAEKSWKIWNEQMSNN